MVQAGSGRRGVSWARFPGKRVQDTSAQSRRAQDDETAIVTALPLPVTDGAAATGDVAATPVQCDTGPDDSIDVSRLTAIVRLTPAQALALAADVLAQLEECEAGGHTGCFSGPQSVRVASDGRARLVDGNHLQVAAGPTSSLTGVATLLEDLIAATRPSARRPDLVEAIERAAAEARRPEGRISIVAGILRAADASCGTDARPELARLVGVVSGRAPVGWTAPAAGRPSPRPRPEHSHPEGSGSPQRTRVRVVLGRSWAWGFSVIVLGAVIATEIVFFRDDLGRDVRAVLQAGRAGSPAATGAALTPVIPPGALAGGGILGVDLRPLERCAPGSRCSLRTQVRLRPLPAPQTVSWTFQVVDRCTGAVVKAPGGTAVVPAHADRLDVVNTVALPMGRALAVLVLTDRPFSAAGEPVYVPADGTCSA